MEAVEGESVHLLSPNSSEIELDGLVEPDFSVKRSAYAASYYENCLQFCEDQSLSNLQSLDRALDKVHPDDIDVGEAEKLVQLLRPFLELSRGSEAYVLWSCRLILKLQTSKPSSLWLGSVDTTEKAASSFRDVCSQLLLQKQAPPVLIYTIDAWQNLVKVRKLEEHHSYPLMTSALQWVFSQDSPQDVTRSFVSFIAVIYSRLPPSAKDRTLHNIIASWLDAPRNVSKSLSTTLCELVLSLIAVSGEVPASVWEESVALKSRGALEKNANASHSDAVVLANFISRRLIDTMWSLPKSNLQKIEFLKFVGELASALKSPHWPSAEVFVSSFVSVLFRLSDVIKNPKYVGFMFDCFGSLDETLASIGGEVELERLTPSPESSNNLDKLVCSAIRNCLSNEQAAYLASRQCSLPHQPFFDYERALTSRRNLGSKGISGIPENDWLPWLKQFPIATYYSKISQLVCDLASQEDIRESNQVDLLHLLEKHVDIDPSLFDIQWLDRIAYAVPAICESFIPLVTTVYQKTGNVRLLDKLSERLAAPGASQFKKRTLTLLSTSLSSANDSQRQALAFLVWKASLTSLTDSDTSVQQAAFNLASNCFSQQAGPQIAEAIVAAQNTADSFMIARGLKLFLARLRKADKQGNSKVQRLVKQLLSSSQLALAYTFIQADGAFTPYSQISQIMAVASLHVSSSSSNEDQQNKMWALSILDCTLRARPRVILPRALAASMFSTFVNQLKTANPAQIAMVGSILGQLVYLADPQVQQQRLSNLNKIAQTTLVSAKSHTQEKESLIFRQSVLISSCLRFWTSDLNSLRSFTYQYLDWLAETSNDTVKQLLIRVIFEVAVEHSAIFGEPRVDSLFKSFRHSTREANLFTRLLLKHMGTQSTKNPSGVSTFGDSAVSSEEHSSSLSPNNTMLQGHLARLVALAREEEDIVVLRVVAKAIQDNLLVADECIPVITSLCFSIQPSVSQTALRSFVTLCERWPRNVGIKFIEGLRLAESRGRSSDNGALLSSDPLRIMWGILKQSSRNHNIETMLNQLAQIISHKTSQSFLTLLVKGLMEIEMHLKDAKFLSAKVEDEVNRFDPDVHSKEYIVKTAICYVFVLWMRRRYGLSEHARLGGRASRETDEELEPMNCEALITTFSSKSNEESRSLLNELWSLPDWYGSYKMTALIYGETQKRLAEDSDSFCSKKPKV